jgi:hypothetical protein
MACGMRELAALAIAGGAALAPRAAATLRAIGHARSLSLPKPLG